MKSAGAALFPYNTCNEASEKSRTASKASEAAKAGTGAGTRNGDLPALRRQQAGLDFWSGNHTTGEPAGWRAIDCSGCGGIGSVDENTAATILAKMEKGSPS